MCFGKKPKMSEPKIQQATPAVPAAPIADQTPSIVDGADTAGANRAKRRTANPNGSLSLFQIQLVPGAVSGTDEPGAAV